MNLRKKFLLVFLLMVIVALGYLRDYIFISINEKTGQGPSGVGDLFIWKWPLTVAFALVYLLITSLFLHLLFTQKKYIRIAVFVYAFLFFVSFAAAGFGSVISSFEKVYPFVRTLMGIAQSPIVIIILIPFFFLNEKLIVDKKGT